jgi:predicted acylesterase/phospholipase RssA
MKREERPKVAIACQGGGSHAAFTAGMLTRPAVATASIR